MLLNFSDEDEVCDLIQAHITDLNNIDCDECLFSLNDCLYDYDYKLSVNNNCNNDICEYYLKKELMAKMKIEIRIYCCEVKLKKCTSKYL